MTGFAKRLFVGIKISKTLQNGLDNPAPGTKQYFEDDQNSNSLQIIHVGEHRFIGTYVEDGCPASAIGDAGRSICSTIKLITRGGRFDEDGLEIYSV